MPAILLICGISKVAKPYKGSEAGFSLRRRLQLPMVPIATLTLVASAWLPLRHLPPPTPSLTRGAVLPPPLMCESSLLKELAPSRNRERRWTANEMGLVDKATATITRTQTALREKTTEANEATMARDKAASLLVVAEKAARDAEASARAVGEEVTAVVESAQAEATAAREALVSAAARYDAADEAVAGAEAAAQAAARERDDATARAEAAESVSARFADALEKKAAEVRCIASLAASPFHTVNSIPQLIP